MYDSLKRRLERLSRRKDPSPLHQWGRPTEEIEREFEEHFGSDLDQNIAETLDRTLEELRADSHG